LNSWTKRFVDFGYHLGAWLSIVHGPDQADDPCDDFGGFGALAGEEQRAGPKLVGPLEREVAALLKHTFDRGNQRGPAHLAMTLALNSSSTASSNGVGVDVLAPKEPGRGKKSSGSPSAFQAGKWHKGADRVTQNGQTEGQPTTCAERALSDMAPIA
jgi:hypothetical protein